MLETFLIIAGSLVVGIATAPFWVLAVLQLLSLTLILIRITS
jgi:hypothetical protein